MEGARFIRSIRLKNFLSYGEDGASIDLEPLNVLIGPNGSGKSNLIEAISILRSTPTDLNAPIRGGGGIGEWIWKRKAQDAAASIDVTTQYPDALSGLRHVLELGSRGHQHEIRSELIEYQSNTSSELRVSFIRVSPDAVVGYALPSEGSGMKSERAEFLSYEGLKADQSILAQVRLPKGLNEITYLFDCYSKVKIYRSTSFSGSRAIRLPQSAALPDDFLLEDASNLGLILNDLDHRGIMPTLLDALRKFLECAERISTKVSGNTVQFWIHEQGLSSGTPASRLSDGTIRYLCLLAVLCHPAPPPLLCIEEPELGLHPDILPAIADLLVDASQRTQIIVTTHSAELVSALSDHPESVLICERDEDGSHIKRLERERLSKWLEKYTLGDLWLSGEIGGTRW